MKIAFVFDGVFVDSSRAKEDVAWRLLGKKYRKSLRRIDRGNDFLSRDGYIALKERVYETRENGLMLDLFDSVLYYLGRLKSDGHQLFAVTLRSEAGQKVVHEWCYERYINLNFIAVENRKIEPEYFTDFDVFIAKKPSQLWPLVNAVSNLFLFIPFGMPVEDSVHPRFQLVRSWESIYRKVLSLTP